MTVDNFDTHLGIIVSLIACQTLFLKWLMTRSDKLIDSLTLAVKAFDEFRKRDSLLHKEIIDGLNSIAAT